MTDYDVRTDEDGNIVVDGDGSGGEEEQPSVGAGAMPSPQREAPQRRGGRPKGARNKATIAKEQGVAATPPETSRPAGKTGTYPGEEGRIPEEADLLWMYIIEEIAEQGFTPYDMEIRVDRKIPAPAQPMTTFDGAAVMGNREGGLSPATALRNYVIDWVHMPSGVTGPGLYTLHFCWKNKAHFFRRGELRLPSRNECIAMKQSEQARQSQDGAAGLGAPPPYVPHAPQQQQQQQPQYAPAPQPCYPAGFGAPPPQQQQHFDPDLERARIRAELEREQEIANMRRELDDLRRRPPPPIYGPGYGNGYPPPQPMRRGAGAPPHYPQPSPYDEDPDARTARVVVSVLQQMGIGPQRGAPPGAPPQQPGLGAPAQPVDAIDALERALDTATRTKKVLKRAHDLFEDGDDEEPKAKPKGAGSAADGEAPVPKMRFQPTGQKWKGHDTFMPIDENDEPIFPTTLPQILATGMANPFLLEPIAQGVGEMFKTGSALVQRVSSGLGAPQQQPPIHDSSIHVQQAAPPPAPYYPPPAPLPQQPLPQPASPAQSEEDGGWNLT